ncbi:MAG: YraN family protein [Dethiobacteria bacterium]|nr:YraN family protein [Bacillota bacterium]
MTKKRLLVGQTGETAARRYLEKLGYKIIESNYRCSLGEIDLIAHDNRTIVLAEVRTRTSSVFGSPEESITAEKARRLRRLALYYLQATRQDESPSRIDLLAVMLDKKSLEVQSIRHIKAILSG